MMNDEARLQSKTENNNMSKKKLKVAMIGHKRIPSREGGIEIVVEELATRMVKAGHEVHVYNRSGGHVSGEIHQPSDNIDIDDYKGIKIIKIPTIQQKSLNAIVYTVLATARATFSKYDCIHYHAEGPCSMLWLPHLLGIRTVATIHGLDWKRAKWGKFAASYLKFGEKIAAKYADEVIVLSENVKNYFKETYNREVEFIPNGVLKQNIKSANEIKSNWNLEQHDYILFLGRIVPEKGVHYLIEAFMNVETDKKLVIAGGSSHSNEYFNSIRVKASGNSNIIFTDFVQGNVLEELFSNAYIYVLPSELEGMPLSLLEALSFGNCCLVSDIPECVEVISNNGYVFQSKNVQDLTRMLNFLLLNKQNVDNFRMNAASYVCNKYNWDDITDRTSKLYIKDC